MKSVLVLPLILIAIIIASVLHQYKTPDNDDDKTIDKLAIGLKDIKHSLSEHQNVSINTVGVNDRPIYLWCRYLLAPCYCPEESREKFDTVLTICSINATDSLVNSITAGRKIICSDKNDQYKFYLTCTR